VDAQRFDQLARAVGGNGSRRRVLRGLAGAIALLALGRSGPSASAQGSRGPGDACWDDSQCSASVMNYSSLVCADNGFDYDGPLNCCTGEGGFCFSDEGCCGSAYCNTDNARCVRTSSDTPYFPGPGDPCQVNDECFALGLVCDYVGLTDDSRCCGYEGSSCGWDGQCCGWLTCGAGGYCTSGGPGPGDGLPLGAQCQYATQCSGGGYYVDCADNGGYVTACCLLGGQSCSSDLDCCMPNSCIGGYCGSAAPSSCTGYGCPCIDGVPSCDYGLECCVQGDPGAGGICGPVGNCYAAMAGPCTGVGCDCSVQDPYTCDPGLFCCGPGGPGARGTCQRPGEC
jgi:hypothetical protein